MAEFETPITAAARRIVRIIDTGYLPNNFRSDLETLMRGALAYEVVTGKVKPVSSQERSDG
jgi:hypothetical protein